MKKTGNVAAIQHQLGHRNATYTLQYARPSFAEMEDAIEERAGSRRAAAKFGMKPEILLTATVTYQRMRLPPARQAAVASMIEEVVENSRIHSIY